MENGESGAVGFDRKNGARTCAIGIKVSTTTGNSIKRIAAFAEDTWKRFAT
jgi:hypothetical protein